MSGRRRRFTKATIDLPGWERQREAKFPRSSGLDRWYRLLQPDFGDVELRQVRAGRVLHPEPVDHLVLGRERHERNHDLGPAGVADLDEFAFAIDLAVGE